MLHKEVRNVFEVLQNGIKLEKGLVTRGSSFGSCNGIDMRLLPQTFQYHEPKLVPVFPVISMVSSDGQQLLQNTREH